MRVLVGCEFSQVVTKAFRDKGHEAYSCDLLPGEINNDWHFQCDIRDVLNDKWDLGIFHPPCTYLSVSGMHWTTRGLRDPQLTEDALDFVRQLMEAPIPKICIENPVSVISSRIRKPDQIIQPWWWGDDASKKTCLWLKGLSKLTVSENNPFPPKGWNTVRLAMEMSECECCGEPYCKSCDCHYDECTCIGPSEAGITYKHVDGFLFGTRESPAPKMVWGNQTPSGQVTFTDTELNQAIQICNSIGFAGTTLLRRKMGISHDKAQAIINRMEGMGLVEEFNASRPRKVMKKCCGNWDENGVCRCP